MGKKESILSSTCLRLYGNGNHEKPNLEIIKRSGFYDEVCRVYKELGGQLDEFPAKPGPWDIDLEKCIIELDEENHFNRYRLITLESPIYEDYENFNVKDYKKYSKSYEKKCPTGQKRWSNPSSDRQFGESGINGDFSGNGPSRWKQRAFYDYLKDVYSLITGTPVIRISIYDQFGNKSIKQILDEQDSMKLKRFLETKVVK